MYPKMFSILTITITSIITSFVCTPLNLYVTKTNIKFKIASFFKNRKPQSFTLKITNEGLAVFLSIRRYVSGSFTQYLYWVIDLTSILSFIAMFCAKQSIKNHPGSYDFSKYLAKLYATKLTKKYTDTNLQFKVINYTC